MLKWVGLCSILLLTGCASNFHEGDHDRRVLAENVVDAFKQNNYEPLRGMPLDAANLPGQAGQDYRDLRDPTAVAVRTGSPAMLIDAGPEKAIQVWFNLYYVGFYDRSGRALAHCRSGAGDDKWDCSSHVED